MPYDRPFEVGDHVVIRDWDDMVDEFPDHNDNRIHVGDSCSFVERMKHLCGQDAVITRVYKNRYGHTRIGLDMDIHGWQISPGMLRHADDVAEVDRDQYIGFISFE